MARLGAFVGVGCRFIGAVPKLRILMAAGILAGAASLAGGQTLTPRGSDADARAASFAERFFPQAAEADCAIRNWPYLEAECLRMPDGSRARAVRMIAVDRQIADEGNPSFRPAR